MFVHAVNFRLHDHRSAAERGSPASNHSPDDQADHDRYQVDPIHHRFIETCGRLPAAGGDL